MRITADLLANAAEQRINPLQERELVLQGLGISAIENMGSARDDFDAWDLSNNRISRLENFPKCMRLRNLLCAGNLVESVDAANIEKNVPNLTWLVLSQNRIRSLNEIINLGKCCKRLEFLALNGNPVTRRQYYRLYTIHCIPSLKVLDFEKINPTEREQAARLASSAAGAALESDLKAERTFVPGEGGEKSFVHVFTPEEKETIRQLLMNAKSAKEIEHIERSVQRGILPNVEG